MTEITSQEQLKSIISRIEELEEDKKSVSEDIKEVYLEAKGNGFDTKAIRRVIKLRKMAEQERKEQEELVNLYSATIGME